jgi:hypothetical protein
MENLQGNLAAQISFEADNNCEYITITDGNSYSPPLVPVAKKAFLVRKHTNGDQILFASLDSDYNDSEWSVTRSIKGGAGFKDGWNYLLLLAFPVTVGIDSFGGSVDKEQIVFYQNAGNTFSGFFIATLNMGGVEEPELVDPENQTGNQWRSPSFDEFYSYIAKKTNSSPLATNMEYGYAEDFTKCVGDICRNRLLIEAGCSCECNSNCELDDTNKANLLVESINILSANRNYKKAQSVVEELELLCNGKV